MHRWLRYCTLAIRAQPQKKIQNLCHLSSGLWISPQNGTSVLFLWHHPFPGFSDTFLFLFYHRYFFFSLHVECPCWLRFHPQPLLFSFYMRVSLHDVTHFCIFIYHVHGSQLCSCSPPFSLELQIYITKCLLDNSTWMSHRHFHFNKSEPKSAFFSKIPFLFGSSLAAPPSSQSLWLGTRHESWFLFCKLPYLTISTSCLFSS